MSRLITSLTIMATILLITGCNEARNAWSGVFTQCVRTDPMQDMVYFGPSNSIGLGSIWREQERGGLALRWLAPFDQELASRIVVKGKPVRCEKKEKFQLNVKPTVILTSLPTGEIPISAELDTARSTTVSMDSYRVDLIAEGEYEQYILGLPTGNSLGDEMKVKGGLVMAKAVVVDNLRMQLVFDDDIASKLRGKYPNPTSVGVDLSLEMKWVNSNTLEISSPAGVYISGELSRFKDTGFVGSSGRRSVFQPKRFSSEFPPRLVDERQ